MYERKIGAIKYSLNIFKYTYYVSMQDINISFIVCTYTYTLHIYIHIIYSGMNASDYILYESVKIRSVKHYLHSVI